MLKNLGALFKEGTLLKVGHLMKLAQERTDGIH
jgi:hypothetical protein